MPSSTCASARFLLALLALSVGHSEEVKGATFPPHLVGNASAVSALVERVLPGSSAHFQLSLVPACPGVAEGTACFVLTDGEGGTTAVAATSASELTGGVGV